MYKNARANLVISILNTPVHFGPRKAHFLHTRLLRIYRFLLAIANTLVKSTIKLCTHVVNEKLVKNIVCKFGVGILLKGVRHFQ